MCACSRGHLQTQGPQQDQVHIHRKRLREGTSSSFTAGAPALAKVRTHLMPWRREKRVRADNVMEGPGEDHGPGHVSPRPLYHDAGNDTLTDPSVLSFQKERSACRIPWDSPFLK